MPSPILPAITPRPGAIIRKQPAGPVMIPDARVVEFGGEVRLVRGPAEKPQSLGIFSSRKVADATCEFLGGQSK